MKHINFKTVCFFGLFACMMGSVYADTLRMAYSVAPKTIDPYKSSASATASLNEHVYEALVSRTNEKLLGTSYEWVDDTTFVVNLRKGVKLSKKYYETEASGNITIKTVKLVATTGVDRISVGNITHSAPAVDLKLEI